MSKPRTFKVDRPLMKGEDIKNFQKEVKAEFKKLDIVCPIVIDGVYDERDRSFTASLCHALGMTASTVMRNGVTPELRTRIRNRDLTVTEKKNFKERIGWRRDLRDRWKRADILVHRPVTQIITSSWDFHGKLHDGIDVVCPDNAVLFSMVRSKVIDVRRVGWWKKGAPANPAVRDKGDGIIQLEILDTVGPFIKGRHIGYGHAEHPRVRVGQTVKAGDPIGRAGLANISHIHLMYNDGKTEMGVGNLDPRKILDYSIKNG